VPVLPVRGLTPPEAFRRLRRHARPFWLDAASAADGLGRWSFLGCEPRETLVQGADDGDAFAALAAAAARTARDPGVPGPCPVWVGALGYDLRRLCERLPARAPDDLGVPDLAFARYDAVLRFDHETGAALVLGADAAAVAALAGRLAAPAPPAPPPPRVGALVPDQSPAAYTAAVERILEYVRAGDVYEVCYTLRCRAPLRGDPAGLYLVLRDLAPAPLGAYLPCGDAVLLSNSPELFLAYDPGTRRVESRPIKGTRPRGRRADEDERLRRELHADPKEIAEHVMIVDLVRNDLGRVATVGSVGVEGYGRNVALPTVHHRVSTVRATLRPGAGLAELLRATFPGGSVTGAPKVRAMEIIDELEPCRRGPYCGAFGFVGARGEVALAMAIRTAVFRPSAAPADGTGTLHLHVGGAIVADSDPARELQETRDKATAFTRAIAALQEPAARPTAPAARPGLGEAPAP
jgi:para-aminobenzoate synthetase component 1